MLLHSACSAAFPFFLPLESPRVIFKDSPGRSGFTHLAIQYFLTDSHPPYDSFNHTVYHTLLHALPCLPSHLISTMACETFALPKEDPFNFWDSWSPAELAGGLFWWKKLSKQNVNYSILLQLQIQKWEVSQDRCFDLTVSSSVPPAIRDVQLSPSLLPHFLKTRIGDTTVLPVSQERRIKKEAKRKIQASEPLWGAGSMLQSIKWLPRENGDPHVGHQSPDPILGGGRERWADLGKALIDHSNQAGELPSSIRHPNWCQPLASKCTHAYACIRIYK